MKIAPTHRRAPQPAATAAKPVGEDRPEDVLEARDRFTLNNYQSIGVEAQELQAGAELVKSALQELGEPHIFVNRSLSSSLELLQKGGKFTTIFDTVKDPSLSQDARDGIEFYLMGREAKERRLDTHGRGDLAGHTVYGSLGFSESLTPEVWEDGLLAPAKPAPTHLNSGIALTEGAVTFVLKAEANERATFLPSDTYDTKKERPVAEEQLPFAVWANIGSKGDFYFNGAEGSQALLALPTEQGVDGVKRFLTSDAINRGYMEAQVRGADLGDVERIVVRHQYSGNGAQTGAGTFEEALAEVQRLAAERGIPCQVAD